MDASDFLPSADARARARAAIEEYNAERAAVAQEAARRVPRLVSSVVAFGVICGLLIHIVFPSLDWVSEPYFILVLLTGIGCAVAYHLAMDPASKFQQGLRARLFPTIFSHIEGFDYRHRAQPASFDRLPRIATGGHNRQRFDDVFAGSYGGFPFELYEVSLRRKSGKSESKVFSGVVFAFQSPVSLQGVLVANRTSAGLARAFRDLFGGGGYETLETGDREVDSVHEFRSDNPAAARPLVNGDFVKALDWLHDAWPDQPARVAVSGEDGFLLIPTKRNLFELPGIRVPLVYETHVEPIVAEFATIYATAALLRSSLQRSA